MATCRAVCPARVTRQVTPQHQPGWVNQRRTGHLCSRHWCRPNSQTHAGLPSALRCGWAAPPSRSCRLWGAAGPSSERIYRRTDLRRHVGAVINTPISWWTQGLHYCSSHSHRESESFFMFWCRYWCRLARLSTSLLATASNNLAMQ